jgi:hypothetical protein
MTKTNFTIEDFNLIKPVIETKYRFYFAILNKPSKFFKLPQADKFLDDILRND